MTQALWRETVLARSDDCVEVEGNLYFPPEALSREHLRESSTTSVCGWKGVAHYYDVVVDGEVNRDAAWYYPEPKEAAREITGHVAFWRGVVVQ